MAASLLSFDFFRLFVTELIKIKVEGSATMLQVLYTYRTYFMNMLFSY
jgi:hypothetical protein